jgi:hypothetical protein
VKPLLFYIGCVRIKRVVLKRSSRADFHRRHNFRQLPPDGRNEIEMEEKRTQPREDETAIDIYYSAIRAGASHASAAKAVEAVMKAEEENNE